MRKPACDSASLLARFRQAESKAQSQPHPQTKRSTRNREGVRPRARTREESDDARPFCSLRAKALPVSDSAVYVGDARLQLARALQVAPGRRLELAYEQIKAWVLVASLQGVTQDGGIWRVLFRSSAPGPDAVGGFPSSCRFAGGCPGGRESQGSLITAQLHPLGQVWILPDLAENRLAKLAGVEKFDDLQEIVVAWPSSALQQCSNVRLAGTFRDISVKI